MELSEKEVIEKLNSEDEATRLYIIDDILMAKEKSLTKFLVTKFGEEKSNAVKESIIFTLKKIDCKFNYPEIFKYYLSTDAYLRNSAVNIMSCYDEDAVVFLSENLGHSDREVRKLILDTIAEINTPTSLYAIRASLYDPSINVVITAVEYLSKLRDRESIPELFALLNNSNEPMLKMTIIDAIYNIGKDSDNAKLLEILKSNSSDINNIDKLYIPYVIRIFSKIYNINKFIICIKEINDYLSYSKEILDSLTLLLRENIKYNDETIIEILKLLETMFNFEKVNRMIKLMSFRLIVDMDKEKAKNILEKFKTNNNIDDSSIVTNNKINDVIRKVDKNKELYKELYEELVR